MGGSSAPMAYTPASQAQADSSYMGTQNQLTAGNQNTYNTAATGYNQAYQNQITSPYAAQAQSQVNQAANNGWTAGAQNLANAQQLQQYAPSVMQSGFDPQGQLYNYGLQQAQAGQNVTNAQSGLTGSPFAAGLTNDAATNYQMQWQAGQQARQNAALSQLSGIYGGVNTLGQAGVSQQAAAAMAPQQAYTDINNQNLAALNSLVSGMGTASAPLQSDVSSYGNYLGLGQAASAQQTQATQVNNSAPGILSALTSLGGAYLGGLG